MVRTSFTPGAAVATKSRTRTSGPRRPSTGTFRFSLRYSRRLASVSIDIAKTPGWISRGWKPAGRDSKRSVMLPLASTSMTSTRLPCSAASSAIAAVMVVLPTPPFPVKKSRRNPRRSGEGTRSCFRGLAAEAHAPVLVVDREFDVGDLVERDADAAALVVVHPEEVRGLRERLLDVGHDLLRRAVDVDGQLLGRVDDADPDFHARASSGTGMRIVPGRERRPGSTREHAPCPDWRPPRARTASRSPCSWSPPASPGSGSWSRPRSG